MALYCFLRSWLCCGDPSLLETESLAPYGSSMSAPAEVEQATEAIELVEVELATEAVEEATTVDVGQPRHISRHQLRLYRQLLLPELREPRRQPMLEPELRAAQQRWRAVVAAADAEAKVKATIKGSMHDQ